MKNIVWIYGPNGSGKTTLTNFISGLTAERTEVINFPFNKNFFIHKLANPEIRNLIIEGLFPSGNSDNDLAGEVIDLLKKYAHNKEAIIVTSQFYPPINLVDDVLLVQSIHPQFYKSCFLESSWQSLKGSSDKTYEFTPNNNNNQ
jgi:ABC-type lipoprotein export system ATPase subunit